MYNRRIMKEEARIQVLPDTVASAIAAGEVIERPTSVIKELIENSIDAGATRIQIEVEDAGSARITIRDDGSGIHSEDVILAVERYATSKLRTADDLFNIQTLGFRGEALSSIGAVSRLELVTRTPEEAKGSRLVVEGGEVLEQGAIGAARGTTVTIRDLFFNVPARRKFQKSERTERRWIQTLIQRYALAYPQVAFQLVLDGRDVFETSGSGDRRELLAKVFSLEIAHAMIALPVSEGLEHQIGGFVSPPHISRSNRREITFFVNGRWVQDSSLSAAVIQAYHTLLMVGRFPVTVIFINLPADQVDVNVHPTKAEIRFREPQKVFSLLQRAVRATLLGQTPAPQVDLQDRWYPGKESGLSPLDRSPDWHFPNQGDVAQSLLPLSGQREIDDEQVPLLRSVGQVGLAYLVAEGPNGVYLIDQHAAHERILFEEFMHELETETLESQALLEALTLEFSSAQAELLRENIEEMTALGFSIEEFGGQSFRLRSIPSMFVGKDPEQAIRAVVEDFEEDETPLASKREARLAARICKRLAIKSGQLLSLEEQRALIRSLECCASPRTCPHGRPTMVHLPVTMLARQFGRR
jgi:DNA mismatch repair protein MutL